MNSQNLSLDESTKKLIYALHVLFEEPSIVLIQGETWKDGKTDFALFLSEWLLKIRSWFHGSSLDRTIVTEVASNIDTKGHYKQISDLISIRQWLHGSPHRKLYICDELNEHLKSRRTMTNKNVGFIDLIPQISKGHGRMIAIGHDFLGVDKELLNDTWCKGIFIKQGRKNAKLISRRLPEDYLFENISPTSIPFDPYAIAPLTERPSKEEMFKDDNLQKLWLWSTTATWKDLFKHPNECNRFVRSTVRKLLEKTFTDSHL